MTCYAGTNVIACGPPPGVYHRRILACPVCERRRRHIIRWDGAWYGTTVYCACGDRWQDGSLGYRPFVKGWRKKAQAEFRAMWDNAAPRDLYDAVRRADCDIYGPNVRTARQERKAFRRYAIALETLRRARAAQ